MNDTDFKAFKESMDAICDYYDKDYLSEMALKIYFRSMREYSLEQIGEAISAHLSNSKAGQYFPKAADLIRQIEGGDITPDEIVAAAKLANCPMGVMARIHIGTWDLNNMDSYGLRQRAQEVMQMLPDWQKRARAGDYTDHEVSIMLKHGINPVSPFFKGLAGPAASPELQQQIARVSGSPRHQLMLEDKTEPTTGTGVSLAQTMAEAEKRNG